MEDKRIFVSGATGTQGNAVAKALINAGLTVRAIVKNQSLDKPATHELEELGVEIVEGDFDDEDSVKKSLEKFNGEEIDLAGDELTMTEVTEVLNTKSENEIEAIHVSEQQAIDMGISKEIVSSQLWDNEDGYEADIEGLKKYEIPMLTFRQWVNL